MGLQQFEQRLEQLVEGAFSKAFRSGLQPVEIGRRLVRELDDHRTLSIQRVIVPNHFTVGLSEQDHARLAPIEEALAFELAANLREHARLESYSFVGTIAIALEPRPKLRPGQVAITSTAVADPGGRVGTLVLTDGQRVELSERPVVIGRLPECDIVAPDPGVSRHHAEVRAEIDGFHLIDLGSTNGTIVNGVAVRAHHLEDGDELQFGSTVVRFEAS